MTREDRGHYGKKHAPERKLNPAVADAVKKRAKDGTMACAVAFDIAGDLNVPPAEVGFTLDMLEIRLVKCQLGLFGYGPGKKLPNATGDAPEALKQAIRDQSPEGMLPCVRAWEIAEKLELGKRDVSAACDSLGIKIRPCQLGAF